MSTCSIAIASVTGQQQFGAPPSCRSIVTVSGTVTSPSNLQPCQEVQVWIECPCGATSDCTTDAKVHASGALTGAGVISGYLVNGQWELVLWASCCCGEPIKVDAACLTYGCTASVTTKLSCDPCCPTITVEKSQQCQPDGKATVTFFVKLDLPPGCPPVTAWMDFGDGSAVSASHLFNPPSSSFTWTHIYPSGAYLPQVIIGPPADCPGKGVPVTVACPQTGCCPALSVRQEKGDCDAQGKSLVTLTVAYSVPAGCPPAQIQVDFGHGPLGSVHTVTGAGSIVETCLYPSGSYAGHVLVLQPAGCPAHDFTVNVNCPANCCPTITAKAEKGDCLNGGLVATFAVTVAVPAGCPPVVVRLDFGDGTKGAQHSFASSGSYTETHSYPTGTYPAAVEVLVPAGCPSQTAPVTVQCPPPDCCPELSTEVSYGGCDGAGNAAVTFLTTVTPKPAPCPPAKVQIDFGGGNLGAVHTFATAGSFSETQTFGAGPHTAAVNVISPQGCEPEQVDFFVPCPDCCPAVTVVPCIPDCGPDVDRIVEFEITVAPKGPPCPPKAVSFQMDFGDGGQGQPVTIPAGGTAYTYTETHIYSGADALNDNVAAVVISDPPECAGAQGQVIIPKCCKKKLADPCWLLFLTMSWGFTLALLFLLFWVWPATPPPTPCNNCTPFVQAQNSNVLQNLALTFAILGVVALIVYLIICLKCLCGWLFRLLWRVLFGAGLLFAIHARCAHQGWLTWLVIGLMILLAFFLLWLWKRKCCVSLCKLLSEIIDWVAWNVLALASLLLGFGIGKDCHYVLISIPQSNGQNIDITVYQVAVFLVSLLGTYYLKKCPPARRRR
jgi:hypothetical protein